MIPACSLSFKFPALTAVQASPYLFWVIFLSALLILIVAGGIAGYYFITRKLSQIREEMENALKDKKKLFEANSYLEREMEFKSREHAHTAMYIVQKNELSNKVAKKLIEVASSLSGEGAKILHNLAEDLLSDTDDQIWEELHMRFQEVHQGFYDALNEKHPDLSPNEKKLAAFLRLNLSTKDIAAITHQSPDSIKVARSRMRKKMGIDKEDNIVSYLESL